MEKKNGGCQCGKVRYEAEVDLTQPVIECNCSICQGKGMLLAFIPEDKMAILSGKDALTEYRFNTEKIAHLFCSVCGVQAFARATSPSGEPTYAINVRTLDGIDLNILNRTPFDGRSK
ncbi:GFA family protein [Patescibacteria group bacterium]|nr:GFA family protein [Patescibacteria group bacterium]